MVGLVGGSTARAEHVVANAGGEAKYVRRMHRHAPTEHQCTSTLVKHIKAPVHLVCPPLHPALSYPQRGWPRWFSGWTASRLGCYFSSDLESFVRFPMPCWVSLSPTPTDVFS
jgi:hypothetical protein